MFHLIYVLLFFGDCAVLGWALKMNTINFCEEMQIITC